MRPPLRPVRLTSRLPRPVSLIQPGIVSVQPDARNASAPVTIGRFRTPSNAPPNAPLLMPVTSPATLPEAWFRSGAVVTIRMTPPSAPVPYSVPWGPRRISTRSMSTIRRSGSGEEYPIRASSRYRLTSDWLVPLNALSATPRRKVRSRPGPRLVENAPSVVASRSTRPRLPARRSSARSPRILIDAGRSERRSSRLLAVTMISPPSTIGGAAGRAWAV